MILFLSQEQNLKGEHAEALIHRASRFYCKEMNIGYPSHQPQIMRTNLGKPYFNDLQVEFSISHSGGIWACMMSSYNVGIDIQEERSVDIHKIARRFFTTSEANYVELYGESGFFDVWTRKEAYVKYLGTGIKSFSSFEAAGRQGLAENIDGTLVWQIELSRNLKCAVCAEKKEEICITTIS